MGGHGSGRKTRTRELINSMKGKQFEPLTPIATEMFLPNLSGDHSKGRVNTTPTTDFQIANKKYVDDKKVESFTTSFTAGSVVFSDGTTIAQDNANFFWDDSNKRLGIGTTSPSASIHIKGASGDGILNIWNNAESQKIRIDQNSIRTETATNLIIFTSGNTNQLALIQSTGNVGIGTVSPVCDLDVNGGFAANLVSKTANYTATTSDHTILCGAGNETFTITLPAASNVSGIIYNIKNIGTGTITVDGNASETIDGSVTATLSSQFGCITIQCDGSNWHII